MSGPKLAVAISRAGGLGFIGPGETPKSTSLDLEVAKDLLAQRSKDTPLLTIESLLPVGVGFQTWNGDLNEAALAVALHRPCAAWLFAPRHGQEELNSWTACLRSASPQTQIWIQVGTLSEALAAVNSSSPPNVLVVQGAEAGGHGRAKDGIGLITLVPEIADATPDSGVPLIAAGGIADGRGVAAALGLGAAGVAMGTRFLASHEARIRKGYQDEVIRATDGAMSTTRTHLYNHLRGTWGWPEEFSPRGIINQSWLDHQAGMRFEELKKLHDEAAKSGDAGWGPDGRLATYAGASVGLVRSVEDAGVIVQKARGEAKAILISLVEGELSKKQD
jgi:nitronate monooxygenase